MASTYDRRAEARLIFSQSADLGGGNAAIGTLVLVGSIKADFLNQLTYWISKPLWPDLNPWHGDKMSMAEIGRVPRSILDLGASRVGGLEYPALN